MAAHCLLPSPSLSTLRCDRAAPDLASLPAPSLCRFPSRHHISAQPAPRSSPGVRSEQRRCNRLLHSAHATVAQAEVLSEDAIDCMTIFLDSLKWDQNGLVAAVVQVSCSHPVVSLSGTSIRAASSLQFWSGCV